MWWRLLASAALCVLACGGCGGPRVFRSSRVPADYLMPPVADVQAIDLSRLASQAGGSNQIGRGDLLEVTIESGYSEHVECSPVRVAEDGSATVPVVGRITLAGIEPEKAERVIAQAAIERGIYRNPAVTVEIKAARTNRITVVGAVEEPDVYELPQSSSSLLAALVAAGGLNEAASNEVEVRKMRQPDHTAAGPVLPASFQGAPRQPASFRVDLVAATEQGQGAYPLDDGDVVMVLRRDPQPIVVSGLVNEPGRVQLPANKDMYLLDAIAEAGGLSTQWADRVHLTRQMPGQDEPIVVDISLREARRNGVGNLRLGPGDVINVEQTPLTVATGAIRAIAPSSLNLFVPLVQ